MPIPVAPATVLALGVSTAQSLIEETKRHLLSFQREHLNLLAANVAPASTSLTFTYDVTQIQTGSYIEIDLELMYVWSVEPSSKTVTVARGQLGSVPALHDQGDMAVVNPKFPAFAILKAINDDLQDLCTPMNGLYAVRAIELTGTATSNGYNLTGATNVLDVLSVERRHPGRPRQWSPVTNFSFQQNAETDDFASGYNLTLAEGVRPGQPLRVLVKQGFNRLVNLTDEVEAVGGLPARMHDLPPLGAAMRMVMPREIKRNFTEAQGEPRRAQEVPAGAVAGSMRAIAAQRQNRIMAEAGLLAQQFPERSFIPQPSAWGW